MGRRLYPDFKFEHLAEALEKNRGFVHAAQRYIKKTWGWDISYSCINERIKEWDMEEWLLDLRKNLVEDCLARCFHKGAAEGDNHCIFWILEKYGHHVDYLGSKDADSNSKKGWKELLEHVKRNPESNSEAEPS